MKHNLVLIVKWIVVPLSFCGVGYFIIGPSLGKDFSIKHETFSKEKATHLRTFSPVNSSLKTDKVMGDSEIEFAVEDITSETEVSGKESIYHNFPQSSSKAKKQKKKVSTSSQSPVKIVEESTTPIENSESDL